MTFTDDERGQPVVIGALLIFTILILAFAGYQAFAVPNQNAEVEFNHFQDVQSDFSEFETSLVNAVESGDTRSTSIDLGPQYPSRMLALNPPPAAGSLRTTEPAEVSVIESGSSVNVCRDGGTATSRSLVYRPGYAEFDNANSIVYENRFTGRQFREGNVFGEQRLVESASGNDRINLLLLTGEVSENGIGVSNIEMNATSRYSTTVSNPTVTLPSRFSADEWENEILSDRTDVTASDVGTNQVELDFDGGDYSVSCAVAGLNSEPAFSPPEETGANVGDGNNTYHTRWTTVEVDGSSQPASDSPFIVDPSDTIDLTMKSTGRESGLPINNPFVDYTFAYDVSNEGAYGFSQSPGQISGSEDTIQIQIPDSSETEEGDSFEAYVTAGDDSDVIAFEVTAPVEFDYTDGPRRGENNEDIRFTIKNVGTDVSISSFEMRNYTAKNKEFDSFEITPPSGGTITGSSSYNEGETVTHSSYDIAVNEEATYELVGFNKNTNNKGITFVVTTENGEEYEFPGENV